MKKGIKKINVSIWIYLLRNKILIQLIKALANRKLFFLKDSNALNYFVFDFYLV